MPKNVQSNEDLFDSPEDIAPDDESAQAKFQTKQQEIRRKEIERATQNKAVSMGLPYVNLFGFPISPEALVLINEQDAIELALVCFYYDGKNIRLATTNTDRKEIKEMSGTAEKRLCFP